jgi:hypothetical protein
MWYTATLWILVVSLTTGGIGFLIHSGIISMQLLRNRKENRYLMVIARKLRSTTAFVLEASGTRAGCLQVKPGWFFSEVDFPEDFFTSQCQQFMDESLSSGVSVFDANLPMSIPDSFESVGVESGIAARVGYPIGVGVLVVCGSKALVGTTGDFPLHYTLRDEALLQAFAWNLWINEWEE